ncbi:MAG: DUF5011 domain-containing protein [Firmicutes bacterium]|nr:DUF5011 domain-containing protein [Bacillota bacterium]
MSAKKKKLNKKKFIRFIIFAALLALAAVIVFTPVLIKMNGDSKVEIGYGESYEDAGASLLIGKGQPKVKSDLDTSKIGKYKITYSFLLAHRTRTVSVVDRVAPVLTLEGSDVIYMSTGAEYTEQGFKAWDEIDGDITSKVEVSSDLNKDAAGVYHISYVATDAAGNAVRERRTVNVVDGGAMEMDVLSFDLNPFYPDVICKDVGYNEEKFADLLLFGDSFIEKFGEIGMVAYRHLWSRPSISTDDFYTKEIYVYGALGGTFWDAMDEHHPENVLVLLNSDWTSRWTPEYLNESCDKAYAQMKERYPDTNFIICSIMPVEYWYDRPEYVAETGYNRDDRINKMNVYMCELCRKYGFKFMNAAEAVKDPNTGACIQEYIYEPDGIHLSDAGCQAMLDYIMCHLDY